MKFAFGSFRLRIRRNFSDPDPAKRFEYFRFRIHNTASHAETSVNL